MNKKELSYIKNIAYLLLLMLLLFAISIKITPKKIKVSYSSVIEKVNDIEEIKAAQVKWRGIADTYKDEENQKGEIHIRYESIIVAKYSLKDFKNNIKIEGNTIYLTVPKVEITADIVGDEDSISFIPENTKLGPQKIWNLCTNDAEQEALANTQLVKTAESNFKNIIEGLLYPITNNSNYEITWVEGDSNEEK